MEINVNHNIGMVEIWLTNQDQHEVDVDELVENAVKEYGNKKYRVVVFRSGKGDLYDCAEGLIAHNRAANTAAI